MKRFFIFVCGLSLVALAGCQNEREQLASEKIDVTQAKQELGKTTKEARKDMSEARKDAAKKMEKVEVAVGHDIATAAAKIDEEKKDVAKAEADLKKECDQMSKEGKLADRSSEDYQVCQNIRR